MTKIKIGTRVVFLVDVKFVSEKGRITYGAKIGSTGTVGEIDAKNKVVSVELDRPMSSKRMKIEEVRPSWIAPVIEQPVEIHAPKKKQEDKPDWSLFSYEELGALAQTLGLTWTQTANTNINRMWVINALNKAGVTPPKDKDELQSIVNTMLAKMDEELDNDDDVEDTIEIAANPEIELNDSSVDSTI